MVFVVGLPVIVFLVTLFLAHKEHTKKVRHEWHRDTEGVIMPGIFATIISVVFGFLIALFVGGVFLGPGPVKDTTYELKMLNDTKETSGTFFLASGSIDEDPVFYYYQSNGQFSELRDIDPYYARIVEGPGEPKVVYSQGQDDMTFWGLKTSGTYHVTFYIPEGSITNNYTLGDLND